MTTLTRLAQATVLRSTGQGVGPRQVLAQVSGEGADRMNDVVVQAGVDFKSFMQGGGPVLWNHDPDVPVARTLWMRIVNGALTALAQFPEPGVLAESDRVYSLIRSQIVNSVSIGFRPIEREPIRGGGVRYTEVELIEYSYVSTPAQPSAVIIGRAHRSPTPTPRLDAARARLRLMRGEARRWRARHART